MAAISIGEMIRFGWETFKARPWFLIGVVFLAMAVSAASSYMVELAAGAPAVLVFSIADIVIQLLVSLGLIGFMLKAHDNVEAAELSDLWVPEHLLRFAVTVILVSIAVLLGFIALIIPGLILMVLFMFAQYTVVDKRMGPIEAMKESIRLTRGSRLKLFGFIVILALLNVLGVLALFVGLLITVPITMLATVHAYRVLDRADQPAVQE